jgi:hypothetical protein
MKMMLLIRIPRAAMPRHCLVEDPSYWEWGLIAWDEMGSFPSEDPFLPSEDPLALMRQILVDDFEIPD